MYETIFGLVFITIGTVLILLGSRSHRRTGSGTGTDSGSVRADLERAGDNNKRIGDAVRRAGEDNQRSQELVQKAKHILNSAKHTD